MNNISREPTCEFCGQPLQREISTGSEELSTCVNSKCPAQRLSHIESRLENIEKLLEISPIIKEKGITAPEEVEVPEAPEAEPMSVFEQIRGLPTLSFEDGNTRFYSLINQLEGSRSKLEALLEQIAMEEFFSHQDLRNWAILMGYTGKVFLAAQRVLRVGGNQGFPIIKMILNRHNSVFQAGEPKVVPSQFYSNLLRWAQKGGLETPICNELGRLAGIVTPPVELPEIKKPQEIRETPSVTSTTQVQPSHPTEPMIPSSVQKTVQAGYPSWIDRFRPKEGWEFAIGANWLRWVGIGVILIALLALVSWSSQFIEPDQLAILAYVGLILSGVLLHIISFVILRYKERSHFLPPIAYSIAFLSMGIYFIAIFILRFHPSSPISGIDYESIYLILSLLLIFITGVTAWRHNASILFIEGFGFVLWLFWHLPSQMLGNDLEFSGTLLWLCYMVFILAFLVIGYLRKDIVLTICIQLSALSLLVLPNSSEVFSTYFLIPEFPDLNATIILLLFFSIAYWILALKFPSDVPSRLWDLINRNHLTSASVAPLFISFFLSWLNFITNTLFVMCLILFCILWSFQKNIKYNFPNFFLRDISYFDFVTYSSVILFLITFGYRYGFLGYEIGFLGNKIGNPGSELFALILGFIAFPVILLICQHFSSLTLPREEIREIYVIINSIFVSIIFIFMVWGDLFSQLGDHLSLILETWDLNFLEILGLTNGHNWALGGYLWIVFVTIIVVWIFRVNILQVIPKLILVLSPSISMFIYFFGLRITIPIALLFVLVGYIHLIILSFLFIPRMDSEDQPVLEDHYFVIPGLGILQLLIYFFFSASIIEWNILITPFVTLLFPFSLGILMILRRTMNHIIDTYLIISAFIFTFLQFFLLPQYQQGEGWLIQLIFLSLCLIYVYSRIFFGKNTLSSSGSSPSVLEILFPRLTFTNKENIGINLLIFCILGFISSTLCFILFGAAWSPIIVLLLFDSVVVFPLVFSLKLFGIDSRVALTNTLAIYSAGIVLRLPFLGAYDVDYNILLVIGIAFQVLLHGLLIRMTKTEVLMESAVDKWLFKFKGRETWSQDSFRIMAIFNSLAFYLYSSIFAIRMMEIFTLTEFFSVIMIAIAIIIAIYFVLVTKFNISSIITDSGLFFSFIIAWLFTISSLEYIFFTSGATAFLCIIYGFWINKKEWRIMGLSVIGISLIYIAFILAQLPDDLIKILGFGALGIISIIIGFVYSKFANRFVPKEEVKIQE